MKLFLQMTAALGAFLLSSIAVTAQDNFSVRPFLGLAQVYDNNIFFDPEAPARDLITRVSPGLECTFLTPRLSLSARYDFDAEVFSEHPELTNYQSRRNAGLQARYRLEPRLELVTSAGYADTRTPGELNLGTGGTGSTGLLLGRARGEQMVAAAGAEYRLGPLNSLTVDYTFTGERLSGGPWSRLQTQTLGIERNLDARSSITFRGLARFYSFEDRPMETVPVVTAGWSRQLTQRLSVSLSGGPRFSDSPGAEVLAELRMRWQRSEVGVNYARTQSMVIGLSGHFDTESASGLMRWGWESGFEMRAGPSFLRTRGGGLEAMVYRLNLELLAPLGSWLTVSGSADFGVQRGGAAFGEIRHDIVMVRLIARKSPRERSVSPAEVF